MDHEVKYAMKLYWQARPNSANASKAKRKINVLLILVRYFNEEWMVALHEKTLKARGDEEPRASEDIADIGQCK